MRIHRFSWSTGVSLELPVGYAKVGEDDTSVLYAAIGPDDVWPVADTRVSRLQVRTMGAPADPSTESRTEAVRAVADGFAGLDADLVRREERVLDGELVATVVVRARDGGWMHLSVASTPERMLSLAGTTYDEAELAVLDDAVASIRFVDGGEGPAGEDGWATVTALDLLLSLEAPQGWEGLAVSGSELQLRGGSTDDDYRPTISIEHGRPEEPGEEWFSWFCVAATEALAEGTPGFDLLTTDRFDLSSVGARVFLLAFHRTPDPGTPGEAPPTTQLQAYVWAGPHRMYVVSAATRRDHEARDLPVFERVVRSLRLLPPRTHQPGGAVPGERGR